MEFTFNQQSRTTNVLKASSVGSLCHFLSYGMGFAYRTIFIAILSASYLGINGLFWNLLAILSLAELGIGEVIIYRFYKPIAENNLPKVSQLMAFFKQIYLLVATLILAVGLLLFPFLDFFIKDKSGIPPDVNINHVYLLYLAQSVISYTFVYRLSIWTADQKRYVSVFLTGATETVKFLTQIIVLWLTRNFMLTLGSSIAATLLMNIMFSWWTTRVYKPVFIAQGLLSRAEKLQIFKDAGALMCHKLGSIVVSNTDSIILSKFVGLLSVGIYSNYTLLVKAVEMFMRQALGGFTASFGNAAIKLSTEEYHIAFRRMQFLTLAVSGWVAASFCLLADGFVQLWLGADMVFARIVTIILSINFYMAISRLNADTNIAATGLFVKDKPRPVIQAALNLIISVILVKQYDIAGVFLGTIISSGLTVFWRVPYILYANAFKQSVWNYWGKYALHTLFSAACVWLGFVVADSCISRMTWLTWLCEAVLFALSYLLLFILIFGRTKDFGFFVTYAKKKLSRA